MKVFELLIDEEDELSGTALISLVKDPATQISWEVFNEEENHTCDIHEYDFSEEHLSVLEQFGEELNPNMLVGAKITPVEFVLNEHGFVSVPNITSDPRRLDIKSGDSVDSDFINRYIYVVDTAAPGGALVPTSRELCRKMIGANRVYSRQDIDNLSQALTSAADSFKLVFRKKEYTQVDYFRYKAGKYCRHRWFQLQFPVDTLGGQTTEEALSRIPIKADRAIPRAVAIGGDGSRPFQSEWSIDPPGKSVQMSEEKNIDPIALHMGVFLYSSRFAALIAEPTAKKLTKVKICMEGGECMTGWAPLEIAGNYYENTAEVMEYFEVRETFAKIPDYMREAAKRAVDYAEENGWGDCGTDTGKRRANDLADETYTPSMDILSRMYSYGSRHKVDWDSSKSIDEGCGYLMLLSWGFSPDNYDAAMKFLERELEKSTELNVMMSSNEYQGDITAVVFQPNQKIYRWDRETNQPYYVFMSRETIRKMLMKFQRTKVGKGGIVNLEHSGYIFDPNEVYTYENWLVGDDPEKDKSFQIFGRAFEPGTWITTIHIKDSRVFEDFILSNKTRGVSLEGMFQEVPFNFFEVKEEEFVKPQPGETKDDFIGRCVPVLIGEGKTQDQALGACYGMWENKFSEEKMGMIAIDGGVPIYADEYEARAAATSLGCRGAHQMDGGWAPCDNHEDAISGLGATDEIINKLKDMLEKMGGRPS